MKCIGSYKKFTRAVVHFRTPAPSNVTVRYWIDQHPKKEYTVDLNPYSIPMIGAFTIGTHAIGGVGSNIPVALPVPINKRGRTILFEFESTSGPVELAGLEVFVAPGSFRGNVV